MSLQLVLGQDDRKFYAEIEVVFEDGTTVLKRFPANVPFTIHFEDFRKETSDASAAE